MSEAGVKIDAGDLAQIRRMLRRIDPEVDKALRKGLRDAANVVRDEGKRRAPVRSGALRRSIRSRVRAREVSVGSKADHASVVHEGKRHPLFGDRDRWYENPRVPFLDDAVAEKRPQVLRMIEHEIESAVRSVSR